MIKKFKHHFELCPVSKEDVFFIILPISVVAGLVTGLLTYITLTIAL